MAPYIFVFTWIIAELELILFLWKDSSLFGRENEFIFQSSLCERSHGYEENLGSVPNGEYHEGRFVSKPLTLSVWDIFNRENPQLGEISQSRHISLAWVFLKNKIVHHMRKKKRQKKSCWDFIQHCRIYILKQLPWKAAITGEKQSRAPKVCRNISGEDADEHLERGAEEADETDGKIGPWP